MSLNSCQWRSGPKSERQNELSSANSKELALVEITATSLLEKIAEIGRESDTQAVVVNVWAHWCAPCKEELPELLQFAKDWAPKGVRVLLVSADSPEDRPKAREILSNIELADFKLTPASYVLSEAPEVFMKAFEPRWSAVLPATFFFNRDGKQVSFRVGQIKRQELESRVKPLLKSIAKPTFDPTALATPGKMQFDQNLRSKEQLKPTRRPE